MIAYLEGTVLAKNPDSLIIKADGVGYLVYPTAQLLAGASLNQRLSCFVYTNVRDDAIELYGFTSTKEQQLFRDLVSVSGVGAKTAIAILSHPAEEITQAIQTANLDFFTDIPRLGRKNAQKIIIELKNKYHATADLPLDRIANQQELIKALQSMGYSRQEAHAAAKSVPPEVNLLEDQLRYALKSLS